MVAPAFGRGHPPLELLGQTAGSPCGAGRVRPTARDDPEAADPMHVQAALRAVEGEVLELALQIGLHLEQLQSEHLRVGDKWIGPAVPNVDRLVDEGVGLHRLLGDCVDGVLEDVAFAACHCEMLARGSVDRWGKPRNEMPHDPRTS
jgi:hypothetical protein